MKNVRYELLQVKSLFLDPKYQREVSKPHVKALTTSFDERLLGTIVVSFRDDKYYILDGQHRVMACKSSGVTSVMAVVLDHLTMEEEAELFDEYNRKRKGLTRIESFKAQLAAGNDTAEAINKIAAKHGVKVTGGKEDNTITAIAICMRLFDEYGPEHFDRTVGLIKKTWGGQSPSLAGHFLTGVAAFLKVYGSDGNYSEAKFIKQLGKVDSNVIMREMKADVSTDVTKIKALNTMIRHYNHGLVNKLENQHYNLR